MGVSGGRVFGQFRQGGLLRSRERRGIRRASSTGNKQDCPQTDDQEGRPPKGRVGGGKARPQQDKIAVTGAQKIANLSVASPCGHLVSNDAPEVAGKVGVRIIDRLTLADQTAGFGEKRPRPSLEVCVPQLISWVRGAGDTENRTEKGADPEAWMPHLAATASVRRRPAAKRNLRSDREIAPPRAINRGPAKIRCAQRFQ